MSHFLVRETSAGESGIAFPRGSSACSIRSRRAGLFSAGCVCCPPRARRRAPSTEPGVTMAAPKANTASTTVTKTMMTVSSGVINKTCSNPNPDNLPDHEISHRLQTDSGYQQGVANWISKQWMDEITIDGQHHDHNDGRHSHQQGHSEASLGGVNAHLALNLEALADDIGEIVENFGQVAARLALQHDCGDKEFHIDKGNALRQIHESIAHGHAELLLFKELAKFSGHWFGHFAGNHLQGGGEGVSGPNRAGERVDGLGKEFLKFLKAPVAPDGGVGVGQHGSNHEPDPDHLSAARKAVADESGSGPRERG